MPSTSNIILTHNHDAAGKWNPATRLGALIAASACALSLSVCPALASGHATVSVGNKGATMKIEWRDAENARFSMPGVGGHTYTLLHNGKLYVVANGRVMPMAAMAGMLGNHFRKHEPTGTPTLVGPVGTETDAGVEGRRYRVHWSDANGNTPAADRSIQNKQVVLSSDRRVRELWRVWGAYMRAEGSGFGGHGSMKDVKEMTRLFGDRGLLRMGKTFRVVAIDGHTPSASDLALPAHSSSSNPAAAMFGKMFGH